VRHDLDVGTGRHLEERRTPVPRGQLAEDRADRRDRGLVAGQQQPGRRTGLELDASELVAAPRRQQHQAVAGAGPLRPGRPRARRAGRPVRAVHREVDDEPRLGTLATDVAHRV